MISFTQENSFSLISHSTDFSEDSIPELEPVCDPPSYAPFNSDLPSYRETILRTIDIIEREFEENRRRIIQGRDQSMIQTQVETEIQIADHLSNYREEIHCLNSLLNQRI